MNAQVAGARWQGGSLVGLGQAWIQRARHASGIACFTRSAPLLNCQRFRGLRMNTLSNRFVH